MKKKNLILNREEVSRILNLLDRMNHHTESEWRYHRKKNQLITDLSGKDLFLELEDLKMGSSYLSYDPVPTNEVQLISDYFEMKTKLESKYKDKEYEF